MFDTNHVLPDLPQVDLEGEMLVGAENFCRLICNTLGIGHSKDFLLNGKTILRMKHHGS